MKEIEGFDCRTRYDGDVDVPELQDFMLTLGELQELVNKLVEAHGKDATIRSDSGYENCSVVVNSQYRVVAPKPKKSKRR